MYNMTTSFTLVEYTINFLCKPFLKLIQIFKGKCVIVMLTSLEQFVLSKTDVVFLNNLVYHCGHLMCS